MKTPKRTPKASGNNLPENKANFGSDLRKKGRQFADEDDEEEDFDLSIDDPINDLESFDHDNEEDDDY